MNARLKEIELNSDDSVKCFRMADGSTLEADLYVSAMPGEAFPFLSFSSGLLHLLPQRFFFNATVSLGGAAALSIALGHVPMTLPGSECMLGGLKA